MSAWRRSDRGAAATARDGGNVALNGFFSVDHCIAPIARATPCNRAEISAVNQIMAMHGHSSPKASDVCTRNARRRVLAELEREKTSLDEIPGNAKGRE